jgi:Flp pilus assembly protein TadD
MPRRLARTACFILLACWIAGCNRNPSSSPDRAAADQAAANQTLSDEFLRLMNMGRNYLEQSDSTNAIATYKKAAAIVPNDADVHLNLAIAYLQAGAADDAIREADEVLKVERNSAAAYFVKGSACLRLSKHLEATKALENAKKIEPGVTATSFQLGLARMGLQQWEEAISAFKEGLAMEPNRLHAGAHYLLAQSLIRAGRQEEAQKELAQHQASIDGARAGAGAAGFERSKYTLARVPFKLEQPEKHGIAMAFVNATKEVFGENPAHFSAPVALIDPSHSGWNSLFVVEEGKAFRLLWNSNGVFRPYGPSYPAVQGANYSKVLVGDLQNDRFEDIIVLGEKASHVLKFGTNGLAEDVSNSSGLSMLGASDGMLMDLDFTGKLDLIAVTTGTNDLRIYRQFGPLLFRDVTGASGIPTSLRNAQAVAMENWNRDENMDVIATRKENPPILLLKQRGGLLVPTEQTNWVGGTVFSTADFDNDLRPDLAMFNQGKITICFNDGSRKDIVSGDNSALVLRQIIALDYDNDGWLDLWTVGEKIRAWRNAGLAGFQEQTSQLRLDRFDAGKVSEIHFADFDRDCDLDAVITLAEGGLRYLRNDGGNANSLVRVQLIGNRSNASGIGCKVEITTGGLRLVRTVHRLPVEIGVGKHQTLDSFLVHWFNWPQGLAEAPVDCKEPLLAMELTIQEGSCPYLYAWDGDRFRFVTDILGAAPLGLPMAEGRYIEADPEEYVWIGNEQSFPARKGNYELRITEELREVLYLDEAKLVVVDHEPGTEVHATDKLLPGKPFPMGTLVTLHNEQPLKKATTLDGREVSDALSRVDGRRVSPSKLRTPPLRGLAEPHGLLLDFGELDVTRPLVLVMNGWLRFGGGTANIAASHDALLPFPFPILEAEVAGIWKPVDVIVGAPAGKTKTIIVDLEGKLQPGTRRLRLTQAFEIHWDRIALMERKVSAQTRITFLAAAEADLHFRGFSALENLPGDWPLTPDYERVSANSYWRIIPGGWCTRYGAVGELIAARDEGLALLNAGDELTLKFPASALPAKETGIDRDYFLYIDGWDKDSDFHVAAGTEVEPLPFHGMNDQLYGRQERPRFPSDALHSKYNTRWVEGRVLKGVLPK